MSREEGVARSGRVERNLSTGLPSEGKVLSKRSQISGRQHHQLDTKSMYHYTSLCTKYNIS